jgi:hypothetical protein
LLKHESDVQRARRAIQSAGGREHGRFGIGRG